jgi:hypothetical protein
MLHYRLQWFAACEWGGTGVGRSLRRGAGQQAESAFGAPPRRASAHTNSRPAGTECELNFRINPKIETSPGLTYRNPWLLGYERALFYATMLVEIKMDRVL